MRYDQLTWTWLCSYFSCTSQLELYLSFHYPIITFGNTEIYKISCGIAYSTAEIYTFLSSLYCFSLNDNCLTVCQEGGGEGEGGVR